MCWFSWLPLVGCLSFHRPTLLHKARIPAGLCLPRITTATARSVLRNARNRRATNPETGSSSRQYLFSAHPDRRIRTPYYSRRTRLSDRIRPNVGAKYLASTDSATNHVSSAAEAPPENGHLPTLFPLVSFIIISIAKRLFVEFRCRVVHLTW